MKKEKIQLWELILKNSIVYVKCTETQAKNKFPHDQIRSVRPISKKDFMTIVSEKGVKRIL